MHRTIFRVQMNVDAFLIDKVNLKGLGIWKAPLSPSQIAMIPTLSKCRALKATQ